MGEAKRRREHDLDLDACGRPRPRDPWCPACQSKRIYTMPTAELRVRFDGIDCDWMGCLDCKAVWEPFPASYVRDPVCAEPCDNCAFRRGSPEQKDPERWKTLIKELRPDGSETNFGMFTGRFYCHKGVPIDLASGPGNFLFPKAPVMFDGKVVGMTEDVRKMRTCSGFLRMVWAHNDKRSPRDE